MWGDDEGGEMVWDGGVSWGGIDGVDGCRGEGTGGSGVDGRTHLPWYCTEE